MEKSGKWALLIGIDKYHESLGSLKYAGADCKELKRTLISAPMNFPEDQVLLLLDDQEADYRPSYGNIQAYLGSWLSIPKEDDLVLVYFSGHGELTKGKTYLIPGDASMASLHTMGIPLSQVQESLERCKAKRKLLLLDACHSGAGKNVETMKITMQEELAKGEGFYTIASCSAEELSHEWDEKQHGVFSYYVSEALKGAVTPGVDGRLTVDSIYDWVHKQVTKWAGMHKCSQTPLRFASGAGSISLFETTPSYEEQNRLLALELEKARLAREKAEARLAEIELERQLALKKEKEKHEVLTVTRSESQPCTVQSWEEFLKRERHLGIWDRINRKIDDNGVFWGIYLFISLIGLAMFYDLKSPSISPYLPIGLLILPLGLVMYSMYQSAQDIEKSRNKWKLICAEKCITANDYIQAGQFALAIEAKGVDGAHAGRIVFRAGELAEKNSDTRLSNLLYARASKYWGFSHATFKLEK